MAGFKIPVCLLTVLHSALVSMYKPILTFKGHFLHLIFFLVNKLGLFSISVFPSFFFFFWNQFQICLFSVFYSFLLKKQKSKKLLFCIGYSLVAQMIKNPPAMRESWVKSLGWEDPLEKGMATHSTLLAQRIPWTKEDGGLQSMGSQRITQD